MLFPYKKKCLLSPINLIFYLSCCRVRRVTTSTRRPGCCRSPWWIWMMRASTSVSRRPTATTPSSLTLPDFASNVSPHCRHTKLLKFQGFFTFYSRCLWKASSAQKKAMKSCSPQFDCVWNWVIWDSLQCIVPWWFWIGAFKLVNSKTEHFIELHVNDMN